MNKQCVILSGGFGRRLSSVIQDVPKPMAPIKEVPFLEYLISLLKKNGFNSFVFLTGYKSEIIENHFRNLDNATFIKEKQPLGTGGALLNAFSVLQDEFFVVNGDTFFDIDYSLIEDFAKDKPCVIALKYTRDVKRYGFVEINDKFQVKNFLEKSNMPKNRIDGYINSGIYYFKKVVLEKYYKSFQKQEISLEKEIFPDLIKENLLYGLPVGGKFIDIGIPEDYYNAQDIIPNRINKTAKPALFIDKDGTIIKNTEYPSGKNIEIIPSTIDIVKKYTVKDYYIVMVTNQAGLAKGKFTEEQMKECFETIKEVYSKNNILFDAIEYCPYHKDGIIDKYTYDTYLRKPNPGMLLEACDKLKIDLKNSIMIGDNEDIDVVKLPYLKCEIIKG